MDNLSKRVVETKIIMTKLTGNEEIELEGVGKETSMKVEKIPGDDGVGKETKIKKEKNPENQDVVKETTIKKEKIAENEDKAKWYDLGFLQSKVIKKIFFCLNEPQQIGKKSFLQTIIFHLF